MKLIKRLYQFSAPRIMILFFILTALFPFFWTLLTSIKPADEIFNIPPKLFPSDVYWHNYVQVFTGRPFAEYIRNSVIIASVTSLVSLLFGSLAAFSLSRFKIKYKMLILFAVLGVSMFPQVSIVSPLFLLFRKIGLLNTHLGLILPYLTFSLPLTIWFLTVFFQKIPRALEEAALIDGCTKLQIFTRIIFPLARPGLITTFILCFIFCWNEFLFALVFTMDETARTAPVGIALFTSRYQIPWGEICAATVIVTIPLIVLVMFTSRRIIAGLTAGAVKE